MPDGTEALHALHQVQVWRRVVLQSPPAAPVLSLQHLLHCWSNLTTCSLGAQRRRRPVCAEGLAHAIVAERTPDGYPLPSFLRGKRVLQLDVPLLISGAKERGELENRVSSLIAELKGHRDVILM